MLNIKDWSPERTARVGRNLRVLSKLNLGAWLFFTIAAAVWASMALYFFGERGLNLAGRCFVYGCLGIYVGLALAYVFNVYRVAKDLGRFGVGWAMATAASAFFVVTLPVLPVLLSTLGRDAINQRGFECRGFGPAVSALEELEAQRPPSSVA